MRPARVTVKQQRFVEEYLVDLNGSAAARRAGYSENSARRIAFQLLALPHVQAHLSARMKARETRTGITQDRVLREIARVAFGDPRRVMTWGPGGVKLRDSEEISDDDAALISEVSETTSKDGGSLKLKTNSKLAALELLGRHLKLWTDKLEIEDTTPPDPASVQERIRERLKRLGFGMTGRGDP